MSFFKLKRKVIKERRNNYTRKIMLEKYKVRRHEVDETEEA